MHALGRLIHAAVLAALTLAVVLPAQPVLTHGIGVCHHQATCDRITNIEPAVEQMLAEQTARYGPTCVDPAQFKGIPTRVLVRDAHGFDSGVVRVVTLDTALNGAKTGQSYVLKACR